MSDESLDQVIADLHALSSDEVGEVSTIIASSVDQSVTIEVRPDNEVVVDAASMDGETAAHNIREAVIALLRHYERRDDSIPVDPAELEGQLNSMISGLADSMASMRARMDDLQRRRPF